MPQAIRRLHDGELHLIADANYADGDVVLKAGFAGVVEGAVLTGDHMNVRIEGAYDFAAASATTFAAGARVEWDDTNNLAVAAAGGTFELGTVAKAKVAGELVVRVLLNKTPLV